MSLNQKIVDRALRRKQVDAVRPRTRSERRAFTTGYAQALLDVDRDGFESAQAFLADIAAMDANRSEARSKTRGPVIWHTLWIGDADKPKHRLTLSDDWYMPWRWRWYR